MEKFAYRMDCLASICMINQEFNKCLKPFLAKQSWSVNDRNKILDLLADGLLYAANRKAISMLISILGPLTIDMLIRCKKILLNDYGNDLPTRQRSREHFCVLLGEVCKIGLAGTERLVSDFFSVNDDQLNPFSITMNYAAEFPPKRRKISESVSTNEVLYGVYLMMITFPQIQCTNYRWKNLWKYVVDRKYDLNSLGHWALSNILSHLFNLTNDNLKAILSSNASTVNVQIEYDICSNVSTGIDMCNCIPVRLTPVEEGTVSYTKNTILCSDIHEDLVSTCGIILPISKFAKNKQRITMHFAPKIVLTPRFQKCLHSVALAVSAGHPIILEGPPGCGKSTLIEYLAHYSRCSNFVKIQLGEGIDSKVLSGIYQCSVVSGEFEWKAGALAQAVRDGDWVLLEDIDKAPLDVVSLLLPLLENGQMNIPGHSNATDIDSNVFTSTGFRIFMTCRTDSVSTSSQYDVRSGVAMLKRHCRQICMESLQDDDLKVIIDNKYPLISRLSGKIFEIYTKLEDLHMGMLGMNSKTNKRVSSVRDLLRLCRRISLHTEHGVLETEMGQLMVLESIDCFIASSMNKNERIAKIKLVHALLNLSSASADYFWQSYKPEIDIQSQSAMIGRAHLCREKTKYNRNVFWHQTFALTRGSSILLERIACAVKMSEPVLLVGETGVGKTSAIQYLAEQIGVKLHIVNISQQSSSSDLLGAFKPIQAKQLIAPVRDRFEELFQITFSQKHNKKFLNHVQTCFLNKRFSDLMHLMVHCTKSAISKFTQQVVKNDTLIKDWISLNSTLIELREQIKAQDMVAFTFVEGILSQAIQKGDWLLLDEINLASPETLDCLSGVLESQEGSVSLLEVGDAKPIKRHENFRFFAAMNPATDVGKKNLPVSIRDRFLEIYVPEPEEDSDLIILISHYLEGRNIPNNNLINGILTFFREICEFSKSEPIVNLNTRSPFSLRSLCRALRYVTDHSNMSLIQALFEGLCLAFMTEIDHTDYENVLELIIKHIVGKSKFKSFSKLSIPLPNFNYVTVEGYHIRCGTLSPYTDPKYIITPYVSKHIKVLARAVAYGKYPILIQGETSTGKTSIIHYLAGKTGNSVVRINNHEHTDLQEYIGCYTSDENGKFYFQEGPLVTAMRQGHWIILDELNLAPTDILESLNRVLDDNRELFIAETQERVRAHPRFTLFATQNPPGIYGGRKVLSRALRNRFVELHFGEIPLEEIKTILHNRCDLPMSRCSRLVNVMQELQEHRRTSGIFSGKQGFITLRDLFRWAERYRLDQSETNESGVCDWDQQLANDGYLLLAGRVRKEDERVLIQQVIQKHLGKDICLDTIFSEESVKTIIKCVPAEFNHIVFTKPLRKIIIMLHRALTFDEPVLLVGETGCGKTTACQLLSSIMSSSGLFSINCHAHTDASDFLGGLRPVRNSQESESSFANTKLFDWVDGPLLEAMNGGKHLLVDEISLAEDSVLERLNSVLEPARKLVVPDRIESSGAETTLVIEAKKGFQFMSTMNPGGDFGKKELSPALRNRLTEIWCTVADEDENDVKDIIFHNLKLPLNVSQIFSEVMIKFLKWFHSTSFGVRHVKSIRDLIKWVSFCNIFTISIKSEFLALVHGALLVFIDGIGSGLSNSMAHATGDARIACVTKLLELLSQTSLYTNLSEENKQHLNSLIDETSNISLNYSHDCFHFGPFSIPLGNIEPVLGNYCLTAPTTSVNTFRMLRSLQLSNPILLEGSPGIGKTSLVIALARAAGHDIIRINLSEQTDITDLLGADLPVDEGLGGQFSWRDGPLLSALKRGSWVVFDELNLASQSVLEGLNSVFDHRNEIYIPELGRTFTVRSDQTRIFACQNPFHQGGGRKGLPKSFLNRFTHVYMESLSKDDMTFILSTQFPVLPLNIIHKMIEFNDCVREQIVDQHHWGNLGAPWEFNLRDITRWCELILSHDDGFYPEKFAYLIYCERLQTVTDRKKMCSLFYQVFGKEAYQPSCNFFLTLNTLQIGNAIIKRENVQSCANQDVLLLPSKMHAMESLLTAIQQGWMCILTGQSGSGKTTLVKTLASLIGHKIRTFSVNSSMDATELLGGFEQMDPVRELSTTVQHVMDTFLKMFEMSESFIDPLTDGVCNLLGMLDDLKEISSKVEESANGNAAIVHARSLLSWLEMLDKSLKETNLFASFLPNVKLCKNNLQTVIEKMNFSKGRFEWVDSDLVKALKTGDWLLIDGANLCNSSVLDRLNGLLEPNGVLSVTERGIVNGSFVRIRPHPSFRLILSLDASGANLSRAMRNRGIEIHLLSNQQCIGSEEDFDTALTWEETEKVVSSKLSTAVPNSTTSILLKFFQKMQVQNKIRTDVAMVNCINCSKEILEELRTGNDVVSSFVTVCHRYLDWNAAFSGIKEELEEALTIENDTRTLMPIMRLNNFLHSSNAAMVFHQAQLFEAVEQYITEDSSTMFFDMACKLFIRLASQNDYKIRLKLLKDYFTKHSGTTVKYSKAIEDVFSSTLFQETLTSNVQGDMPWDPRWSGQLMNVIEPQFSKSLMHNLHILWLLFSFRIFQVDLDMKMKTLLQSSLNKSKSSKKKRQRRGKKTEQSQPSTGILLCSSLYHSGILKLQELSHPAIAYVYPLYQNILSALPDILANQTGVGIEELTIGIEKISEMYKIWEQFMSPNFDSTEFYVHLKGLYNCMQFFKVKNECDTFYMLYDKIDELFRMMDQLSDSDWGTVSTQNKIRLSLVKHIMGSSPYRAENEVTYVSSAKKLIMTTSERCFQLKQDNLTVSFHIQPYILEICNSLAAINASEVLIDIDHLSEVSKSIEGKLSNLGRSLGGHTSLANPEVEKLTNNVSELLPLIHHVVSWRLMNLITWLMESEQDPQKDITAITEHITQIHKLLLFAKIPNAKLLFEICFLLKSTISDNIYSSFILRRGILTALMTIINQNDLSNIVCNISEKSFGSSLLLKPYVTKFSTEFIFKTLSTDFKKTDYGDLSVCSLDITLPIVLSECDDKLKQVELLHHIFWMYSSVPCLTVEFNLDINLLQNVFVYLIYFTDCLDTLASMKSALKYVVNVKTFTTLNKVIDEYKFSSNIPGCLKDLLQSASTLCNEVKSYTGEVITDCQSSNTWHVEIKRLLSNAVKFTYDLVQFVFKLNPKTSCNSKNFHLLCSSMLGLTWTWTGMLFFVLVAPQNDIDPVSIYKYKCKILKHNVEEMENEINIYSVYHKTMTGKILKANDDSAPANQYIHPYLPAQFRRMIEVSKKLEKTLPKTATRPFSNEFSDLASFCKHLQYGTIFSKSLDNALENFETLSNKVFKESSFDFLANKLEHTIKSLELYQGNIQAAVETIYHLFSCFPDYTVSLTDSLNSVQLGLDILQNTMHTIEQLSCIENDEIPVVISYKEFFNVLMGINSKLPESPIQFIDFAKVLQKTVPCDEKALSLSVIEDVILSLLMKYRNIVIFEGISSSHLRPLLNFLDFLVSEWAKQQDEKSREENKKASIYKVKVHVDDVNEEELDERKLQEIFGKFPDDEECVDEGKRYFSTNIWQIAMEVHHDVMLLIGSDRSVPSNDTKNSKQILPTRRSQLRIDLSIPSRFSRIRLADVFNSTFSSMLDTGLDANLMSANLSLVKQIQNSLKSDSNMSEDFFNIYRTAYIGEVLQSFPVLRDIFDKVSSQFLKDWPDHPTLLRIIETISRIISFPVTLPLINFAEGLETLLGIMQEWEKNASSGVTLQSFMEQVTGFVIKWRKLELNSWNRLLDDEFQKHSSVKPSLYFALYQLILNPIEDLDILDVMMQIESFMESSSISEFSSRLGALRTFQRNLVLKGQQGDCVHTCLKNIHDYYEQYLNSVNVRIKELSQPIEKELKDYVKITKWNDQNFFTVKETVDKTHRHLFKFMKKFNQAMMEEVRFKVLVQNTAMANSSISDTVKVLENGEPDLSDTSTALESFKISNYLKRVSSPNEYSDCNMLHRLPSLVQKLACISAECKNEIGKFRNALCLIEDFISDIVENADRLKNLQPSAPMPKSGDDKAKQKRISEAKNIKLRKQKALNDLFKHLALIGFSYKKGVIYGKDLTSQTLLLSPVYCKSRVDITTSIEVIDPGILTVVRESVTGSNAYQKYFFSNIAKWSTFSYASNRPHKDLTRANIERARGFLGYLMKLSVLQRKEMCTISLAKEKIERSIKLIESVAKSKYCLIQSLTLDFIQDSKILIDDWCMLLHETMLWLDCCPVKHSDKDDISCLFHDAVFSMFHGDDLWLQMVQKLESNIKLSHSVKTVIDKNVERRIKNQRHLVMNEELKDISEQMLLIAVECKSLSAYLLETFKCQSESGSIGSIPKLVSDICKFSEFINIHNKKLEKIVDVKPDSATDFNCPMLNIFENTNSVISTVLIGIQNMKKYFDTFSHDDDGSQEQIFTERLQNRIMEMIQKANISNICEKVDQFANRLVCWISAKHYKMTEAAAESVLFVAQHFQDILVPVQTTLRNLQSKTSKLCHILSNIFINLFQNGFCTPPEFEEEANDDDATESGEAEGGGVGDGVGSNNVSEQIDEDMLEDMADGDGENDGNSENDTNAVEMTNDFDGEFDDHEDHVKTDDESDSEDNKEDENIEKQMGELGQDQIDDKLDEQMWGSDDEDEMKDSGENEEIGKGTEKSESELAAKDDELDDEKQYSEEHDSKENDRPRDDADFDPLENNKLNDDEEIEHNEMNNFDMADDSKMDEHEDDEKNEDEDKDDHLDIPMEESDSVVNGEEKLDDELIAESSDNAEHPEDDSEGEHDAMNVQIALEADNNTTKDYNDNTVNENQSKSETENSGETTNELPPQENCDPQDFHNVGNAPSDGNWDDTNMQSSCVATQNKNDKIDTKRSKQREEQESSDVNPEAQANENVEKRLNIVDATDIGNDAKDNVENDPRGIESDVFQHVNSPTSEYDKKAFDSVQQEMHKNMSIAEDNATENQCDDMIDLEAGVEDEITENVVNKFEPKPLSELSEIHTADMQEALATNFVGRSHEQRNKLRRELENQLQLWKQNCDVVDSLEAERAWEGYCNLTRPLAIELCEQLRLVLEPTQASQLKGDYRTGKRLHMRKIIPYIASGFRKDKIWLRRTKPSKRVYQIMIAVDDSSSMVDNHTKQLAFESVAVIASALSSLEVGRLAICSFGERVQLLQDFDDPLSTKSGASVLSRCTFVQKKTKIADFLDYSTDLLLTARRRYSSNANPNIAQLLLIISDGRGLYLEGRKRVLEAVNSVLKSGIFVAFIILDQPSTSHGSIIDIKVPVFNKPGEMPEIRSYMKDFPFPFYLILRDVNVLPQTLGDALRQWFELVVGSE